ncbi:MAG: sugar O-acetyltransferase [Kocuria sp.]|nr:sugar O-acetyltransferase [Kocuria sp.]MDO5618506.1 sugar O-acetyltransferase [Kocuria sp.]
MLAGDDYVAEDPELARVGARAIELMGRFNTEYYRDPQGSQSIVRELFGEVGEHAHIRGPVHVDYGQFISVGARTFINMGLTALDVVPIRIGEDCQLGPHVQLLAPTHPIDPTQRRDKLEAGKPITIGNNVWLGGGVIVCPGVSIGENSVIGSGAVVTKDIPANVVAVGNPARVIKENI